MALPEYCADDVVDPPCCDSLYLTAQDLLIIAWNAFSACATPDECAPMERLVAVTEPHIATQDYIAVYIVDSTLPLLLTGRTKMLNVTMPRVTYGIKLVESGYPTLEAALTEVYEPTAAQFNWAAWHSMAHAEAIYRTMISTLVADNDCGELTAVNSLRPLDPTGGLVGWTFSVQIEAPWRM